MQDLGGGVSVVTPQHAPKSHAHKKDDGSAEAFRKLSEEIAKITQGVGDPMTVEPRGAAPDPHLDFFLNNRPK